MAGKESKSPKAFCLERGRNKEKRTFVPLKNLRNILKITCRDENSETSKKNVEKK